MVLPIIIPSDCDRDGTHSVDFWICIRMRGRHAARRLHPVHAQKAPARGHRLYGRGLDFTCNLSLDPYYPQ